MDGASLTLILLAAAAGLTLIFVLVHVLRELRELRRPSSGLVVLQNQIDALREQIRASLQDERLEISRRLEETTRVVGEVRRDLGSVDRQVKSVTDVAKELSGLQELLRSPKIRGGMGEYLLAELLAQVLPTAGFELQYEFPGGERVDAVLRVGERWVPVDAKFPLENFRRMRSAAADDDERQRKDGRRAFRADVRRHIDAIAKRYIRPGEGTYEFAMMYLPAESIYQEMLQQEGEDGLDLFHYALTRQVVPVSPQSFYAYLQVIVLGLRGLTISGDAREIMNRLGLIRNRLARFTESFEVTLRHMGNAQRQSEEATKRLARLDAAFGDLSIDPVEPEPTDRTTADTAG